MSRIFAPIILIVTPFSTPFENKIQQYKANGDLTNANFFHLQEDFANYTLAKSTGKETQYVAEYNAKLNEKAQLAEQDKKDKAEAAKKGIMGGLPFFILLFLSLMVVIFYSRRTSRASNGVM